MASVPDWTVAAAHEILEDPGDLDVVTAASIIRKNMPFEPDTAYMPVPRCDRCSHWELRTDLSRHGYCLLLVQGNYARNLLVARKAVADTVECDGHAVFVTRDSFGCVQWDQKTEP